ncbi:MAG: hypothetical protein ACHQE5_04635, partial [Actinomycetes bacterium]
MGHFVDRVWPGDPTGSTRASRTPCRYRAYVPEPLNGASDILVTASVAADLVDVEQQVRNLNRT